MQDVLKEIVGWLHFSKIPDQFIDAHTPRILLPNSDTEFLYFSLLMGKNLTIPSL